MSKNKAKELSENEKNERNTRAMTLIYAQAKEIDKARLTQWRDGDPTVDFTIMMTPEIAALLLAGKAINRNATAMSVGELLHLMRSGKWRVVDSIGLSKDGQLYNGEHRLQALVLFDQPLPMKISYGMTIEDRAATDLGRRGDKRDILYMIHEIPRARDVMAWANSTALLVHGRRAKVMIDDVIKWRQANIDSIEWALKLTEHEPRSRNPYSESSVIAPLIFARELAMKSVDKFAEGVVTNRGQGANEGSPVFAFARYIASKKKLRIDPTVDRNCMLMVLTCVNYMDNARTMHSLRLSDEAYRAYLKVTPREKLPGLPATIHLVNERLRNLSQLAVKASDVETLVRELALAGMNNEEQLVKWCRRRRLSIPSIATYDKAKAEERLRSAFKKRSGHETEDKTMRGQLPLI